MASAASSFRWFNPFCFRFPRKEPIKVLVTGAAGKVGYALLPLIARGLMLGQDQRMILHMLGHEAEKDALDGIKMELLDAALPLLQGVVATCDVTTACDGVSIAIMLAGFHPRDALVKNVSIYMKQAAGLKNHAAKNCKVLVVANPTNTNALILKHFAPSIPPKNITCLTRLDHNVALTRIAGRLNVNVTDVKNVIVWGNHSSTQYPDVNLATEASNDVEKVRNLFYDSWFMVPRIRHMCDWLDDEFITAVRQRGTQITDLHKLSSAALSAASAVCDHMRDWIFGTPKETWVSMGVFSDGKSYDIPEGIFYSFPVTCDKGEWRIVQGISISECSKKKMATTANELVEEKTKALDIACMLEQAE